MKVFYSPHHSNHHPKQFYGFGMFMDFTPDVPERAEKLLALMIAEGHEIVEAPDFGMQPLAAIHTPEYLDYLEHAWVEFQAGGKKMLEGMPFSAGDDVYPLILPVRGMDYRYPTSIVGRSGWHTSDMWMPIGEHSWKAIKASANLAVTAADTVLNGEKVAYALCRPSGHHAAADRGGGNCYLNNAAIAANHLTQKFDRVAFVDIDVHHGNGSQDIFYRRNDILFISLHCDPDDCYPYFAGCDTERGAEDGVGFNLNYPLPMLSSDGPFLAALDSAIRKISNFAPDALVLSLGVDGHEADPSHALALTVDGFSEAGKRLEALGLPTVLVQEGGYNVETIDTCVNAVVSEFATR